MWRVVLLVIALLAMAFAFPHPRVSAASLADVIVGIGYDSSVSGGRVPNPTTSFTSLDWPGTILVRVRDVRAGTTVTGERYGPDGKLIWSSSGRWSAGFALGWFAFALPIPGTPNEERIGQWRFVVKLDDAVVREVTFTINPADRSMLSDLKATAARNADSFTANYRLGVGASLFGEDDVAVMHLKKAADISRRSVYPHLALGRHYLKRGMKAEAAQEFAFARGLLLGVEEAGLQGWLQSVIEEHLKQTE